MVLFKLSYKYHAKIFDIVLGKDPYRFIVVLILSLTLGFCF